LGSATGGDGCAIAVKLITQKKANVISLFIGSCQSC
jgi:hypothetical protein